MYNMETQKHYSQNSIVKMSIKKGHNIKSAEKTPEK